MLASAGLKGLPIATPSICLYIRLLKLNSTPQVAISMSSLKVSSGSGGQSISLQYKASAQVLSRGTLVNRLLMTNEHKNVLESPSFRS